MSNSSQSAFALRLIHSNVQNDSDQSKQLSSEENDQYAHIVGIFINLDTDKDGLITRHQLVQGLHLLGLRPTEFLLRKFVNASTLTKANSDEDANGGKKQHTHKVSAIIKSADEKNANSKISSQIFGNVVMEEWLRVKDTMTDDLDKMFQFANDGNEDEDGNQGDEAKIDKDSLKHLLKGVSIPSALSDKDYQSFLSLLPFDDTDGEGEGKGKGMGKVAIGDLKKIIYNMSC